MACSLQYNLVLIGYILCYLIKCYYFKFLMVYIVDLVIFVRSFCSIIKNHIKDFRDIGSSDIYINVIIDYNNNYMSLKIKFIITKSF